MTTRAWLSQRPVADIRSQIEKSGSQTTTISLFTFLVPAGTALTSASTVEESGVRYVVVGQPGDRPDHRPIFRAAALRRISDMQ